MIPKDGERVALSYLFLFLGAAPRTDRLGETIARDEAAFILTGEAAGAEGLLETSVPGIHAAGDVRSGSIKPLRHGRRRGRGRRSLRA